MYLELNNLQWLIRDKTKLNQTLIDTITIVKEKLLKLFNTDQINDYY